MPIDFAALRGEITTSQVPVDGKHQARLDRAALVDTQKGERLVTEWSENGVAWTSWNRFDTTGLLFTRDLLTGLGVDIAKVTDDGALTAGLDAVTGHTFEVRTHSNRGMQGDRWFTTTYVDGYALGVQEEMDVPIDTAGLPEPKQPADEPLPF
jgi:hypothetical protein